MTPFGIRDRVRNFLGRPRTGPRPDETVPITFILPNGTEAPTRTELRYTLVMASQSLETPIATGCPDGTCGTCVVDVVDSTGLGAPSDSEQKLIDKDGGAGVRMGCHARVVGAGARVKVRKVWSMDEVRGE